MELKTYFAQDRNGNLIPSASVSIFLTGTTTLATGLKNVSGANLANPFNADANGKIQFYAPDGIYDMQVSLGSTSGIKVTFQCLDVEQQLSGANGAADRAETARDAAEAALAAFNEEKATLVADDELAANTGAALVGTSSGKTVQQIVNRLTTNLLDEDSTLSTATLAGKKSVVIDRPMTVVDTDNQGAKVEAGTTIISAIPNQNEIKTTKATQSALRIDGDNVTIKGVKGTGAATSANTATAEFITTRMASVADGRTIRNLNVSDVNIEGFTTGIAVSGIDGASFSNIRGSNMKYSPDGLNSAGGYLFVFGGGTAKNILVDGAYHKLVPQADRHTLYLSALGNESGWENVICTNIVCDWTQNSVDNKGVNNTPFAMLPIHVRTGNGLVIDNFSVRGYCGTIVGLENQYGPITNVLMNNMLALDCQSYQNGALTDTGSIDIGFGGYSYRNQHITINGARTKIVRGTDNSGAKMPAGSDHNVLGAKVDFVNITNSDFTTESGNAVKLIGCNDVLIDNINDTLIDTTSGNNSVYLDGCSRVTIGEIRSNRTATGIKERVYTLTDTCTEITCRFPRRIGILISGTTITVTDDRWSMLNGNPTVNGNTINIPLKTHVSTNAKRTATLENLTMGNITATRVGDIDANTLRVGFWDSNAHAIPAIANVSNAIFINFSC